MNGFTSRHKTLGQLMTDLRARLGFVTQGAASKNNDTIIKSFLHDAHNYVMGELEPPALRKKTTIQVKAGSYLYDWHNDQEDELIDPGRVASMWIIASPNLRHPLTQGITENDRSLSDMRGQPEKYDTLNGQIELFPIPEQDYGLLVEYTASDHRFDRPSDRCAVPDSLVFQHALAAAKAHYRQPDAQVSASTFQNMLGKEKMRQRENRRYFASGAPGGDRDPQVAKTTDGYSLRS